MRSKKIAPVVGIMIALFAVLLFAFSCSRSGDQNDGGDHAGHEPAAGDHAGGPSDHMDDVREDRHEGEMYARSPSGEIVDGVRVVEVKARQFEFVPATIVVRQGERVRLKVTSEDVTHGIAIEAFAVDRKLPPNETQVIELTADKLGTHHFHCSVYCGKGHSDMHGELVVIEGTEAP